VAAGLVTLLAYSRPFWPLFLHVLGAMLLFGAVLAGGIAGVAKLPRATLAALGTAVPAWAVTIVGAFWIESDEGLDHSNATWLGIGHGVLEPGLLVLLGALGAAYWWVRSEKPLAGRIATSLAGLYLVLLSIALLAMSGKWG
jgi:hypothetical protein